MNIKPLALLLAVIIAPSAFAQDYEIKLERPKKAGDTFKLDATMKQSQEMSAITNGNPTKNEKKSMLLHCEGTFKVLEVDEHGVETKTSLTVEKLVNTDGGTDKELLPKGAVILSTVVNDSQTHEVDGKPVAPEVRDFLELMSTLSRGGAKDEQTFGTKERKKKGDTWEVNADAAKKDFEQSAGGMVQLQNFTGKASLDDIADGNLTVSARFTGRCLPPFPPSFVVDTSALKASFSGIFPIDGTKNRIQDSLEVSFSFSAHSDTPEQKTVVKIEASQSLLHKLTPLK